MNQINPLTKEQIKALPPKEQGPYIVRFMAGGQCIQDLASGELATKGSNVIYHTHYWDVGDPFIRHILTCLQNNNPEVTFRVLKSKREVTL